MARIDNLTNFLDDVATSIKNKKGITEPIPAETFDTEIDSIVTGEVTEKAIAQADEIVETTENVKIDSAPFDKCTVIPENGITEVVTDKTELASSIGLTSDKIIKGETILDIEGTAEGGSGGDVKLFETEEEMQADPSATEGDLAVVYKSTITNATVDSQFQVATFPDTVVLDTTLTDYVDVRYRAVDTLVMFDCMGQLGANYFMMDCFSESGNIRIQYQSSDGITYTRTDGGEETIDFGTEIYYEMPEMWNDAIGKFIQIGGSEFNGLFEYRIGYDTKDLLAFNLNNMIIPENNYDYIIVNNATNIVKLNTLVDFYNGVKKLTGADYFQAAWYLSNDKNKIICISQPDNTYTTKPFYSRNQLVYYNDILYMVLSTSAISDNYLAYEYNIATGDIAQITFTNDQSFNTGTYTFTSHVMDGYFIGVNNYAGTSDATFDAKSTLDVWENGNPNSTGYKMAYTDKITCTNYIVNKYIPAPNQFTAIADNVYNGIFNGKNGVEEGTLTENVDNSFADINAELYTKIQQKYDEMEPRVLTDTDKTIDKSVYMIPAKYDGTPLLDISSVTTMQEMFFYCKNLQSIPSLDTSNVTRMDFTFQGCISLKTIPLLDTSNVTNMTQTFCACENLKEIPLLNTSKVTTMYETFQGCISLKTIPLLDTSNVTNMYQMFGACYNLREIPLLDTNKVTTMQSMFWSCTNLQTIPLIDTSNVTDMCQMFDGCTNLQTIPLIDTSKVTTMCQMFRNCTNLRTMPLSNTSNVTNMSEMFKGCTNLQEMPLLNTSNIVYMANTFSDCLSLTDESLNNVLAMCKNATKYTKTKTLAYIGLTKEQATKCTTLSNYSAFTSAGWTTGY